MASASAKAAKRDRVILIASLIAISLLAWAYVISLSSGAMVTPAMSMSAPIAQAWAASDFALTFLMWAAMMVAMMIPPAIPMILAYAYFSRQKYSGQLPAVTTTVFVLGYAIIWTAFSAAATLMQWGLHSGALLAGEMIRVGPAIGGVLLIGAGVYQFTPLKNACLVSCRSPLGILATDWREGVGGAAAMGLRHGVYCLGCCWLLMLLLFVAGVMNLLWVAVIAALVLIEKVIPAGRWVGRV